MLGLLPFGIVFSLPVWILITLVMLLIFRRRASMTPSLRRNLMIVIGVLVLVITYLELIGVGTQIVTALEADHQHQGEEPVSSAGFLELWLNEALPISSNSGIWQVALVTGIVNTLVSVASFWALTKPPTEQSELSGGNVGV